MMSGNLLNNDEVICPNCVHQFRAIPVNVQTRIAELEAALVERTRERDEAIRRADCAMVLVAEMESGNSTLRNAGVIALERAEKAEADRDAAIARAEAFANALRDAGRAAAGGQ